MAHHLHLLPLPKPDGAPFTCSVDRPKQVWPYVERCKNRAAGRLMEQDLKEIEKEFSLGGSLVCQDHADLMDRYLSER